jgi:membrane protein YqaA with SNARE-associated domain
VSEERTQPGDVTVPQDASGLLEGKFLQKRNSVAEWLNAHPTFLRVVIWGIVLGSIITGVALFAAGKLKAENVGYTGAFLINLVGSASVIVPVPGLAAVCGAAAPAVGLNIFVLGLMGAIGSTIGEMTGYLAGYGGQSFVQKARYYDRVQRWVMRRGALALFILAALPTPLFDIAGIASGSLGYPLKRFLFWVFLGKIIKFVSVGYACQQGIDWLTRFVPG